MIFPSNRVRIVIATAIPVNDGRAQQLGADFYSALAGGMSVAVAFQKAAITLEAKNAFPNTFTGKRNLLWDNPDQIDDGQLEWDLYVQPGYENALQWK